VAVLALTAGDAAKAIDIITTQWAKGVALVRLTEKARAGKTTIDGMELARGGAADAAGVRAKVVASLHGGAADRVGKPDASHVVLALTVRAAGDGVAVGAASLARTHLQLSQFVDGPELHSLRALLTQLSPAEVAFAPVTDGDVRAELHRVLEAAGVVALERTNADFSRKAVETDAASVIGSLRPLHSMLEDKDAMAALAGLLAHTELVARAAGTTGERFNVTRHRVTDYLRLDAAAVSALSLTPGADAEPGSLSLQAHLGATKTAMGARLLARWVRQPLLDATRINERLDIVELLVDESALRSTVRDTVLRGMPDVDRLVRRLSVARASLQDLVVLYQFTLRLDRLADSLESVRATAPASVDLVDRVFTSKVNEACNALDKFCKLVETALDLAAVKNGEFLVKASYSDKLSALAAKKVKYRDLVDEERDRILARLGIAEKKLHLEHSDKLGFHCRVSRNDEKAVRQLLVRDMAPIEMSKAGVRFKSTSLTKLSARWQQYADEYERVQTTIVERVLKVAATYVPVFGLASKAIATLDVLASWAHVASTAPTPYCRPVLSGLGGNMAVVGLRHPLVEAALATSGSSTSYVPNDVSFTRDEVEMHIVTGPNMGGKSTHIRAVGLAVVMAQMGCFVPATEATLPIVDSVLARVGAGDAQLRGVSTFMAEMLETAAILTSATSNSLVIVDELGRGTSTYDGFGLAWAIAQHIATNLRPFTFFATHYHELTALATAIPTVHNCHVAAHVDATSLTMLYTVQPGPSDQSLGVHVAELAGFPAKVLADARQRAAKLEAADNPLAAAAAAAVEAVRRKRGRPDSDDDAADAAEPVAKRVASSREQGGGDAVADRRDGIRAIRSFLVRVATTSGEADREAALAELEADGNPFVASLLQDVRAAVQA